MKCYFCDKEASGVCKDCGRAACKEDATIKTHYKYLLMGLSYEFICNECGAAMVNPQLVQKYMSEKRNTLTK